MPFQFEKLKVWNVALQLSTDISSLVRSFPKDELYILSAQMKRAADSVVLNIAEGSTLQSRSEFRRFLVFANRSAIEVVSSLYIAKNRSYINDETFTHFYRNYEMLVRSIQSLIKTLN